MAEAEKNPKISTANDQMIGSFLRIWSHLLMKSLMETPFFDPNWRIVSFESFIMSYFSSSMDVFNKMDRQQQFSKAGENLKRGKAKTITFLCVSLKRESFLSRTAQSNPTPPTPVMPLKAQKMLVYILLTTPFFWIMVMETQNF